MDTEMQDLMPAEAVGLEDPLDELGECVSAATFAKFHHSTLRKMDTDLDGYLRALRKLPSNSERRTLLAGYAKELQPALREILEMEELL